jgi:antitoxin VapB
MSLNIKNEETHKLVRQLAGLTGESMTEAITESVRQRLKLVREQRKDGLSQRLLAIGQDCSKHLKKSFASIDHDKLLYDERGLPK